MTATLPTVAEIKQFVGKTLSGADRDGIDVDTAFYGGDHSDLSFFGTAPDGTEFEVVMTVQSINEVDA